jgi:hypothetical protein
MGSPETPAFNAAAFNDTFFTQYEEQLSDISVAEQASQALTEILTIAKADGTHKSYGQLRTETQNFFANDWIRADEAVMNRMAMEFAQACMGHEHGAELAQDNLLSSIYDNGARNLLGDKHDSKTDATTAKDKKKEKKTRSTRVGWLLFKKK